MLIHLHTQADLEEAIETLVKQDRRLKPILELTGMPLDPPARARLCRARRDRLRPAIVDRERVGDLGPPDGGV